MSENKAKSQPRPPFSILRRWGGSNRSRPTAAQPAPSALQTTDPALPVILTHVVLIGLTPLIPVPFADDLATAHFQRSFVRALAKVHGRDLSADEVTALAGEAGLLRGCLDLLLMRPLRGLLLYPVKKLLRKLFWVLEIRRALNLAAHTYYHGWLLDRALRDWDSMPGGEAKAARVRAAMDRARTGANTRVLAEGFRRAFQGSWQMARDIGRIVLVMAESRFLRRGQSGAEPAAETGTAAAAEELNRMVGRLQASITAVPSDHLEQLAKRLTQELRDP